MRTMPRPASFKGSRAAGRQAGSGGKRHAEVALFNISALNGGGQKRLRHLFFASSTSPLVPVSSRWQSTAWAALPSAASFVCTRRISVSVSGPSTAMPAGLLAMMISSSSYTNTAAGRGGSPAGRRSGTAIISPFCTRVERLLLSVQLDLVLAQGLVQRPCQGGVLIHQVFIQPHRQQAFTCSSFILSSTPDPTKPWHPQFPA